MENISKHISYREGTFSETAQRIGIKNIPDNQQIKAMRYVADKVFEPLREHFGEPIRVSSFFRSPSLNTGIKGNSRTSQHMSGEAMDICRLSDSKFRNAMLFAYVLECLEFDQLIWEHGTHKEPDWVHVSLKETGNRNQVLRAYRFNGAVKYDAL